MATGDGVTDWIDVADFTPGIHSGTRSFQTGQPESAVDGVAQVRDTWGCVANPNGGLEAAPLLAYVHEEDLKYPYDEDDVPVDGAPQGARILGFGVCQTSFYEPATFDANGEVENPGEGVAIAAQRFVHYTGLSQDNSNAFFKLWTRNDLSKSLSRVVASSLPENYLAAHWGNGSVVFLRSSMSPEDGEFDLADGVLAPHILFNLSYRGLSFPDERVSWVNAGAMLPKGPNLTDDLPPGVEDGPTDQWGSNEVDSGSIRVVYHQGRLVWTVHTSFLVSGNAPFRDTFRPLDDNEDLYSDEKLRYFGVLNPARVYSDIGTQVIVDSGRPDMVGAIASINTNELFIVKARGGGVIVRDSMERPSVARYPGVESTGAFPHEPVLVPTLGMVYGSTGGIFAWNGGNQSQQLSQSLDGLFWLTPENQERGIDEDLTQPQPRLPVTTCGKFAYQHPYIYAPNNWIMDIRTGGWFRLHPTREQDAERGHDLAYFDVSSTGRVYAAPDIQKVDSDVAWVQFAPRLGAPKFSWRSQPIARQLRGRQLEFRELNAVVSGHGTIDVSLVGLGGDTQTRTIEVDSDQPVLVVKKYDLRAFDIEVLIQSEGAFIPEVTAVGTLKLESAADVGGGYRSGALASDPVVPGLKVAAPQRFDTGVTFTGTSFPAAQTLPDDDASGWTSFGAGQNLSFQLQTPNAGIPAGTISCWIIRYDVQTAAGDHVGYLYKQAYYTSTMTEVGTNSHTIHVWYRSSGTGLLTGPQSQASNRTWTMDRLVDGENRQPAPTMHRFSLGYKPASVANRN